MTALQRLQLEQSEIREKINGLLALDTLTDEQRGELGTLTTRGQEIEPEIRAALVAEPEPQPTDGAPADAETRERLELRGRAAFGRYLSAAFASREPSGAEHEYAAACGVAGIPVDLFEQDRPARRREVREDAVTPSPDTVGVTLDPVQPFVFAESIAPMLGIEMPTVGTGTFGIPRISTALTAGAKAKGNAAESTAAALTVGSTTPRRVSARLSIGVEDVAMVGQPTFESSLRENLRMALANGPNGYDHQCINGDGNAPNINGLVNQLTDPKDPTAVANFAGYLAAFAGRIDGLWARKLMEVMILTGPHAYRHSAQQFRSGDSDNSFASYAEMKTGGWAGHARIPDPDNNIQRGIVYRMGRPGLRTAVHPTWGEFTIDDIYTDAASGERHFTMHVLVGAQVIIVQPAAYDLVEFKLA